MVTGAHFGPALKVLMITERDAPQIGYKRPSREVGGQQKDKESERADETHLLPLEGYATGQKTLLTTSTKCIY
jgi:hypothetical protein